MSRYLFSFLISVSFSYYVLAGPTLPVSGTSTVYSCKGNQTKELSLSFFRNSEDQVMFLEWVSANPQDYTDGGLFSDWGYIAGIPSLSRAGDIPRLSSIKSGNLAQVASLKAGEYSGILTFSDSPHLFDAQTTVKIMAKEKMNSALGVGFAIPIETTIKNIDGKGGELKLKMSYSETYRIHLKKQAVGPKNTFLGGEDCLLKGFKNDKDIATPDSYTFQLPDAGTKLKYICKKEATPAMELEIMDKKNENVTAKFTSLVGENVSTGPIWMFYFGLGEKKMGGGKNMEDRTFTFKFERPPSFSKGISPAIFHGSIDVFETKKEPNALDSTLIVRPSRKQVVPRFGNQTLIDTQAVVVGKNKFVRIFKSAYSPSLQAPVVIEWSVIDLVKNDRVLRLECDLSSISGTKTKSNVTLKK